VFAPSLAGNKVASPLSAGEIAKVGPARTIGGSYENKFCISRFRNVDHFTVCCPCVRGRWSCTRYYVGQLARSL